MTEQKYKIADSVFCCPSIVGVLEDKSAEYPESHWGEHEAEQRVKDGFLVKVKEEKRVKK